MNTSDVRPERRESPIATLISAYARPSARPAAPKDDSVRTSAPVDPRRRVLRENGLMPHSALFIKTYSVIADMVLAGGGVGVVDTFTARRSVDQLKIVPVVDPLPFEVILLSRREQPASQASNRLKQLIRSKLWDLRVQGV